MTTSSLSPFGSGPQFASFGKQSFAYVRSIRSEDAKTVFPLGEDLPNGLNLWGLFAADGQPLALSNERATVVGNAEEMDLVTLALH